MYDIVHQMRTRIITSPAFGGDRILGAILFENTMERRIDSLLTADYLWNIKNIVPFLKIDKGLAAEAEGVQPMAPMPRLAELLRKARVRNIFGTKMRSVIKQADPSGIAALVVQQFTIARQILDAGLVPIIEPEVDIHCPEKAGAEHLLKTVLLEELDRLDSEQQVMLKLTLPERDDFYAEFVDHPRVVRVVALSGGYTPVSYTHLRAHETVLDLVCRLLLEKKKSIIATTLIRHNFTYKNVMSTSKRHSVIV